MIIKAHDKSHDFSVKEQMKFWSRVAVRGRSDCWPWLGCLRNRSGYGQARLKNQQWMTHRLALAMSGTVVNGWNVLHSCNNPICCNPWHLRTGTLLENAQDRKASGSYVGAGRYLVAWMSARGGTSGDGHMRRKLTMDQRVEIHRRAVAGERVVLLAQEFGVSADHVWSIKALAPGCGISKELLYDLDERRGQVAQEGR